MADNFTGTIIHPAQLHNTLDVGFEQRLPLRLQRLQRAADAARRAEDVAYKRLTMLKRDQESIASLVAQRSAALAEAKHDLAAARERWSAIAEVHGDGAANRMVAQREQRVRAASHDLRVVEHRQSEIEQSIRRAERGFADAKSDMRDADVAVAAERERIAAA